MKWGILIVALIVGGATYYFWQQSHFEARGEPDVDTQIQAKAKVETRMSEDQPEKVIPEDAVMEDGTI